MKTYFGKSWQYWINQYCQSHTHPINRLCHKIGIPMILASLPALVFGFWFEITLQVGITFFCAGWILQFVGHAFEKKLPEFFHDWRFLFVGVRWWWSQFFK